MSDNKNTETANPAPNRRQSGGGHHMPVIEKPKNTSASFKRLVGYFGKEFKLVILASIFMAAGVVLNAIGPRILGNAITDHLEKAVNLTLFGKQMLILLVVFLGGFGAQVLSGIFMNLMSNKVIFRMRKEAFAHVQRLSVSFFDKKGIGDLISRLTNDIETIYRFLSNGFINSVSGVLTLVVVLVAMLTLNLPLAGTVLLTFPAVGLIVVILGKRIRQSAKQNQEQVGALTGSIEESVTGMKVIQSFHREREEFSKFNTINQKAREAAVDMEKKSFLMMPLMQLTNSITLFFVIAIGGYLVISRPSIYSIGLLTAFIVYASRFFEPLRQISQVYTLFQSSLAGAERVFEIFDSKEEIRNSDEPVFAEKIIGKVEAKKVSFEYDPGNPVLKDISFTATPGHVTAIVGPTGAGKTTLLNLMARFYDVSEGSILVDDRDIRDYDVKSLRENIGIVLQEPFFFAATIKENLLYGRPNAAENEMIEASKIANAHRFITKLPAGYETKLIERGMNLSQGERQLLAIARTVLADPPILILDEATSNVDSFTEIHIQEGLARLMKNRTSFIIAHRLSTIKNADQLLVIHNNEIIERGTHEELMAEKGFYYRLYSLQFEKAEITEDMKI
jgi:ATP-binding cassette, subfamily B, multidrug efflux pump